ncbi:MAG: hypothetical protein KDN18_10640 [Verrucomicrobiae bacterium]|nr:hypothetical protein [Verrucomicrobiae bacterium]
MNNSLPCPGRLSLRIAGLLLLALIPFFATDSLRAQGGKKGNNSNDVVTVFTNTTPWRLEITPYSKGRLDKGRSQAVKASESVRISAPVGTRYGVFRGNDRIEHYTVTNRKTPYMIKSTVRDGNIGPDLEAERRRQEEESMLKEKETYPGGIVKVLCNAGYPAQFEVTWQEKRSDGSFEDKTWNSGRLNLGKSSSVTIPPLGRTVRIVATGDVVGKIFDVSVAKSDFGKVYKVYGTIYRSGWSKE